MKKITRTEQRKKSFYYRDQLLLEIKQNGDDDILLEKNISDESYRAMEG
jgi:hypothetical protein